MCQANGMENGMITEDGTLSQLLKSPEGYLDKLICIE